MCRQLSVHIFNISTKDVAVGLPWKLLEFSMATVVQHYLIGANFYVEKMGKMLDQALIPQAQLNYKVHYFISGYQKKQYLIVFLQSSYPQPLICSFAVLTVSYTNLNQTTRKGCSYTSSTRVWQAVNNGEPMNPYLATQLQTVVKYAQHVVRLAISM